MEEISVWRDWPTSPRATNDTASPGSLFPQTQGNETLAVQTSVCVRERELKLSKQIMKTEKIRPSVPMGRQRHETSEST